MVDAGIKKLKTRYSDHVCEILRIMLRFNESERPSFMELTKLVLTSTENTLDNKVFDPTAVASMASSKQNLSKPNLGTALNIAK